MNCFGALVKLSRARVCASGVELHRPYSSRHDAVVRIPKLIRSRRSESVGLGRDEEFTRMLECFQHLLAAITG